MVQIAKRKAYGLLAKQPVSAKDMHAEQRDEIVISAVVDKCGATYVISRFGDTVWELWPFYEQSNRQPGEKRINWERIPEDFRDVCKAVSYRYWMVGLPGVKKPKATTLLRFVRDLITFTRYLHDIGIDSMSDVRQLHIANYVHEQKSIKQLAPLSLFQKFSAIDALFIFADQHLDSLSVNPWPDSSAWEVAGCGGHVWKRLLSEGRTPLIPKEIAEKLFIFAESALRSADAMLSKPAKYEHDGYWPDGAVLIRNACFYLLGVLTGMRCEEIVGIEVGAGRTEIKDGITYHWVTSVEHKTGKGRAEYLMPAMGHEILRVLERWSAPRREMLREQLAQWEADNSDDGKLERLRRIASAREDINRLFIGSSKKGIRAVSGKQWRVVMKEFAVQAGVDWALAPHQLRRLYAWTFVRHRLGNLLFIKEQFKHATLDMSALYAANPRQDSALYDEILDELRSQKVDIIQSWLFEDGPLAGGAGKKIMQMRAYDFPNRKVMIEETADKLNLRSTGHGWCLAQEERCGDAAGLYEPVCFGDCKNGLIDETFKPHWKEIYRHQRELLDEVDDLGPGASERVRRDVEKAKAVLKDLGVDVEDSADV